MSQLKVLLVGYSGANNTGAEALLQADIADLRAVLGEDALLTIPALKDPANLRRYLRESHNLQIVRMPSIFFSAAATDSRSASIDLEYHLGRRAVGYRCRSRRDRPRATFTATADGASGESLTGLQRNGARSQVPLWACRHAEEEQ